MKSALMDGESIIQEGAANIQKGIESVGGRLFLTNQRLIFEAHKFNVQGGCTTVQLSSVETLEKCWTKFLGFFPLFPNSLAVTTADGKEYRFVVSSRNEWEANIDAQKCA